MRDGTGTGAIWKRLWILVLCLGLGLGGGGKVIWAQTLAQQDPLIQGDLELKAEYGYQGIAKSGRFLPLTAEVVNHGQEDFSGTLSVLCMESDYSIYRYEYPAEIPAGQSFSQYMNLSLGTGIDQIYLIMEDSQGNERARRRLKLNINTDTAELFVGVLSDSPENLQYMNGAGIDYGTLRIRTIDMSEEGLPSREQEMDQLDVLLITGYDTSRLSSHQVEAVWEWVQQGGLLLLGTGARAEEVMSAFGSHLLARDLGQPQMTDINMGVEFAVDSPEGATISLMCAQVYLTGAEEVLSSDEISVLTYTPVGSGRVAAAVYDFGDPAIESFCRENISYVDQMFTGLLGEDWISQLSARGDGTTSSEFWSVQSLINTGDMNRLPQVALYVTAAGAYVILAGPGLYFFLKQRNLRIYYRRAVLLLSLCFTGIIYIMGSATRFNGPFFTYVSIQDADQTEVGETAFVNMRSPYNRPYAVELNPAYDLHPITRSAYYDTAPVPSFTGTEDADITVRKEDQATIVQVESPGAFQSRYFELERTTDNTDGQGFTGQIHLFGDEISGTLTNNYSQAVENVAVLFYNQMVLIDHMEPGETVSLDGRSMIYGIMSYGYAMAEQVTGASRYRQGDMEDQDYVQALEQTNLLSFYMNQYLSGYLSQARVVGFSQVKQEESFFLGNRFETYGTTLLTSAVQVDCQKDGLVYRSGLQKEPEVLSGTYDFSTNTMYGSTPLVLEYYLGNDTQIQSLTFRQLSDQVLQSLAYSYILPFSGSVYFFNYDTGNYDRMDMEQPEFDSRDLEPYLSPGNTLTVRYVYDNAQNYSWNIMLPLLTVVGGNP